MSTLLYALGRWSYRHPWRVLLTWLVLLGLAGGGAALMSKGTENTFTIPGTEAQEGLEALARTFPQVSGTSAQLIIVAPDGSSVTDDPYRSAIEAATDEIGEIDGVSGATGPFDDTIEGLLSDDERAALIAVQIDGDATEVSDALDESLQTATTTLRDALPNDAQVALGGEMYSTSIPGLTITEVVGVLIALFVLIVSFRSFVVAWYPLISAIVGVGLALALMFVATSFSTISSTAPMLAMMLGLAVGIDYALFIVARHQDQVRSGIAPEESAARATGTAGSAVIFAGVTVLIALFGLALANIPFLTVMGVVAAGAVAVAMIIAVTLTPALLGFAKGRVIGWKRRARTPKDTSKKKRNTAVTKPRQGFAQRWVTLVTRHPIVTTVAVVIGLGVAAIPATHLALALPNAGVQPPSSEARQTYDLTAQHFGPGENGALIMTGTIVTSTDPLGLMEDIKAEVEDVPGVKEVALATPNETADTGLVQIIPETAPDDPATADLVRELRGMHDHFLDEYGVDFLVTGFTAAGIDISDRLGAALLPFGIFVVGLSLVLLTMVFRSIWVPIKAAVGYLLSIGAAFGAVAAVFELGWMADVLHVAKTGPVISFMPIIVMGVLFGLAMDYEVFLVSRMREEYVHLRKARGGRADRATAITAVRTGFTASSRVVVAAALIMFAVFAAFVPEGDSSIKPIALGLAVGVAVDAFLVRMTLVPAVMTLLGERAWWIPAWLDRALPRFDIEGEAVEHEISRANWPEGETDLPLAGDDVTVRTHATRRTPETTLVDGATFRVRDGGTLLATSSDPATTRAFALTLSGRLSLTSGELRVAGHLLPGRAAWVRSHVGLALLGGAVDPISDLREAVRGGTRLAVIDGIDTLTPAQRDQAAAVLRDAATHVRARSSDLTLVITARSERDARALLDDAHRSDIIALDLAPRRTNASTEVVSS